VHNAEVLGEAGFKTDADRGRGDDGAHRHNEGLLLEIQRTTGISRNEGVLSRW
jgi:hypothetical protein